MPPRNRSVAVLAYDGLCTFEFAIAVEVFALRRPELGVPWYDFQVCAAERGALRAEGGVTLQVQRGLRAIEGAGTVVVPGWRRNLDEPIPASVLAALRRAYRRGARLVSICSGVFVLAATGLLNGLRATTHWRYIDALRSRYPKIRVEPDVLYVDEDRLLTSAGSAAGIDLCLHIVRQDFGAVIANQVARRLVVPPHREGGQAQFVQEPIRKAMNGGLAPVLRWLESNLDQELSIAELAH